LTRLKDFTRGSQVAGILPGGIVQIVDVKGYDPAVVELTYKDAAGRLRSELIFREGAASLAIATTGRLWSFDAEAVKLRLGPEASRIHLAHLFDPLLAVHFSLVESLPHQITVVW
jgi:hypothetical protein